jgi:hypothetical protein
MFPSTLVKMERGRVPLSDRKHQWAKHYTLAPLGTMETGCLTDGHREQTDRQAEARGAAMHAHSHPPQFPPSKHLEFSQLRAETIVNVITDVQKQLLGTTIV